MLAVLAVLLILAAIVTVSAVVCGAIAKRRGLGEIGWWCFVSAAVGPLGWILAAVWSRGRRVSWRWRRVAIRPVHL